MENIQQLTPYGGTVTLEWNPARHSCRVAGKRETLISVTGATGIIDKSQVLMRWAINLAVAHLRNYLESGKDAFTPAELLPIVEEAARQHQIKKEEAATVGGIVHDWALHFAEAKIGKTDEPEIPEQRELTDEQYEQVHNGINSFLDWFNAHDVTFHDAERLVYSKKHSYFGFLDAVMTVDGKKVLCDYKTSKGVYSEAFYQVAGYRLAYEEENGKTLNGAIILHFDKETGNVTPHLVPKADETKNRKTFLACLAVKRREREMGKH